MLFSSVMKRQFVNVKENEVKKFYLISTIALIGIFVLLISSCAPASTLSSPSGRVMSTQSVQSMVQDKSLSDQTAGASSNISQEVSNPKTETGTRVVIKNASIEIIVDDPASAMKTITEMAENMGGFIVNSNLYKTYSATGAEIPEAAITVRVPAEKLNEAMGTIKSLVKDQIKNIRAENITGQDVTSEYTDLESRLSNLRAAEKTLREIMASSTKTEDTLAVYNQLIQITEQIEVLEGQIKYYDESSKMSAITVKVIAQESVKPITIGSWEPTGVARDAAQALVNAMKFFVTAGIWIIIFILPVLIVVVLPFVVIGLVVRNIIIKRKKSRQGVTPTPTPPTPAQ
jgi:hypothetical protein